LRRVSKQLRFEVYKTMKQPDKYVHGMDWGKDVFSFNDMRNYRQYQYDLIGRYIGTNILEVGSGDKSFTQQLLCKNKNIKNLFSIEPSRTLYETHYSNLHFPDFVNFECIDLFDLNISKTGIFDTVILIHVLEHIEHDKAALDYLYSFVSPGGYVLIEVPAMPFLYSNHDKMLGHYRRYNKKTLLSKIDTQKFEITKLWYQDPIGVFGSWYFFKMRKIILKSEEGLNFVKNNGGIYDKYVIPFEKQVERLVTFPFGLSLTAILKRR